MYDNLTRWTRPDHYFGAVWPEYYGSGIGQTRDSDALTRSNFRSMLVALGGESETVIVVRESRWSCGWVEWIAIHETDATALETANEIAGRLKDYPVVDEEDFYELESEKAEQVWAECYDAEERLNYIRSHRSQFDFRDFGDLLAQVRGRYFGGYASELIA